ncbi:TonB-like protein [Plesiocystis pacifica SIR-1]|uniref:TonB-like protein n=1 Tax=Plesiocystis pacifica SIR-1 TaxID=391625 RepID=A6G7D1_9BACT|nr:TonB family protein [Plesiocystis pacifica]EDM78265.1 TonB-like protein [Plesiocystis pacifica SIR-1]
MTRDRDSIPLGLWLGFLAAAILAHAAMVAPGSAALARSLEGRGAGQGFGVGLGSGEVLDFDMVEPVELEPESALEDALELVQQHRANHERPDDTARIAEVDASVSEESQAPLGEDGRGGTPSSGSGSEGGSASSATSAAQPTSESARQASDPSPSASPAAAQPTPSAQPVSEAEPEPSGVELEAAEGVGEVRAGAQGDAAAADVVAEANAAAPPPSPSNPAVPGAGASASAQPAQATPAATVLAGSPGVLHEAFGTPGSPSRVDGVDQGTENLLDSKQHRFASFFNRLRAAVSEQWRPEKVHDEVDPKRTKFGDATRTTIVRVVLDARGGLVSAKVEDSCGAAHLDAEAVRALEAAAPFPNPPRGLAVGKHIVFHFGFTLEFDGGHRVFRYRKRRAGAQTSTTL